MTRAALVALVPAVAFADTPADRPSAFEADRESPPAGRTELGFDGGAPLASWGASVSFGYLDRPFALHIGDITAVPIDHRETIAVGAAIAIADRVVFDLRMPWSHITHRRLQREVIVMLTILGGTFAQWMADSVCICMT